MAGITFKEGTSSIPVSYTHLQPLAWMEGTNLPEEAFTLREHTEAYKKFQHDMHSGTILPIGDIFEHPQNPRLQDFLGKVL